MVLMPCVVSDSVLLLSAILRRNWCRRPQALSRGSALSTEATLGRCAAQVYWGGVGWGGTDRRGPAVELVVFCCIHVDLYRRVKARLKAGEPLPQHSPPPTSTSRTV